MGEITINLSREVLALVLAGVFVGFFLIRYGRPIIEAGCGSTARRFIKLVWLWLIPIVAVLIWELPTNDSRTVYQICFMFSVLSAVIGLVASGLACQYED